MQEHTVLEQILFEPLNETSSNARCWLPLNPNNNTPFVEKPYESIRLSPIGSIGSGFQLGGSGNIIRQDTGYGLQERYDFSRHNNSEPHLNYDLFGAKKDFSIKALGDVHYIPLFDDDDDGSYY